MTISLEAASGVPRALRIRSAQAKVGKVLEDGQQPR